MSTARRWLNWKPSGGQIIETSPRMEPSKPTELGFDGFDGSVPRETHIIQGAEPAPETAKVYYPYTLPEGVRLVRYTPKTPPVAVTVCSVVMDIPKFIEHALAGLAARLHHPVQIKAGDSVFELLSKLADCGLELRLEWPPPNNLAAHSEATKPSKPTKLAEPPELNAHGVDITDEDIPF